MSHDDDDELWGPTEADAKNTKCARCEAPYEVVRPGKIQPTCMCEYVDNMRSELDSAKEDAAWYRKKYGELLGHYAILNEAVNGLLATEDTMEFLGLRVDVHDIQKRYRMWEKQSPR